MITDARTGRSKGYAFVTFAEEAAAAAVKALGKLDFFGRLVDVGTPQGGAGRPPGAPPPPRPAPAGGGGGGGGVPTERRVFVGGLPREARSAYVCTPCTPCSP